MNANQLAAFRRFQFAVSPFCLRMLFPDLRLTTDNSATLPRRCERLDFQRCVLSAER